MGDPFFTFSNTDQNAPIKKNKQKRNNIALYQKTALKIDFGLPEVPKLKTCTFINFWVGALPEVKNPCLKFFSNKVLYKYCSKKNLERFVQYLKK